MWWIVWLIIAVLLLLIQLIVPNPLTIWFGLAASVVTVLSAAFSSMPWNIEILVFIALTVLAFVLLPKERIEKFVKKVNKKSVDTNSDYILSKPGLVKETIDNAAVTGVIEISGVEWRAISVDNSVIEVGCLVDVVSMEGNKLYVKRKEEANG